MWRSETVTAIDQLLLLFSPSSPPTHLLRLVASYYHRGGGFFFFLLFVFPPYRQGRLTQLTFCGFVLAPNTLLKKEKNGIDIFLAFCAYFFFLFSRNQCILSWLFFVFFELSMIVGFFCCPILVGFFVVLWMLTYRCVKRFLNTPCWLCVFRFSDFAVPFHPLQTFVPSPRAHTTLLGWKTAKR